MTLMKTITKIITDMSAPMISNIHNYNKNNIDDSDSYNKHD